MRSRLRDGSDILTESVRRYVATGNKKYRDEYFKEAEAAPISRVAMIGLLGEKALAVDPDQTADSLKAIYLKRPNITKPKKYHYLKDE